MPVYQIQYTDYLSDLAVYHYSDHEVARTATHGLANVFTVLAFENQEDLGTVIQRGPMLRDLYNKLTGSTVARFSDREAGLKRTFEAVVKVATPGKIKEIEKMSEVHPNTEAATSDNGATKRRGRSAKFGDTQVITLTTDKNPKRGASAERFALYRSGMTVRQYIDAGGSMGDLHWDSNEKHKYIEIA